MKRSSLRAPRRLWPRGRLDIGAQDLLFAACCPFLPGARPRRVWPTKEPHLALWSVRTAWDAILGVHAWPRASEIVFSGANIPDMVRLIEAHGLVPVPIAIDPRTLEVEARDVEAAFTPRTRAILMSPLFGSRMDLREIGELAQKHNVLLVEDLAQAFGDSTRGSPEADVSLFSFGLIKTRTALGGAVVFARDARLLNQIARHVRSHPHVSLASYYAKWLRAVLLQIISHPLVFGAFWRLLDARGIDPDVWLSGATRSMNSVDLFCRVRRQPHTAHLRLLRHRLYSNDDKTLQNRIERGRQSIEILPGVLGSDARVNVFWALPVALCDREALIERAHREGFDVSFRASSLVCFGSDSAFSRALESAVFLPVGTPMPEGEWTRLLNIVREFSVKVGV